MFKRMMSILLSVLCVVTVCLSFAACGEKNEDDKGPYVSLYMPCTLTDFDPANAYLNDAITDIVSLIFEPLFVIDEKGNLSNGLASGYTVKEDAEHNLYTMDITLKDSQWTDKTPINADDVIFAWKRLLDYENSNPAASLLFDIQGARDFCEGLVGPDDIGLEAIDDTVVRITFEGPIDYRNFVYKLTNVCTAPLREDYCGRSFDWAKKSSTMVASGPFKLTKVILKGNEESGVKYETYDDYYYSEKEEYNAGIREGMPVDKAKSFKENKIAMFVLERNQYYCRDVERDALDKYVKPYKVVVLCDLSAEQVNQLYSSGRLYAMGRIPLSLRQELKDSATVSDALSTFSIMFNEDAIINDKALFAVKEVRQALSLAIDREALAELAVFGTAATGLVPNGVFNAGSAKQSFRSASEDLIATSANMAEAKSLLSSVEITPSDYAFSVTVNANDEVQCALVEKIVEAWNELGFQVTINKRGSITNNDYYSYTGSVPADVLDDLYTEYYIYKQFEVIALDVCAYTVDPFTILAQFAPSFCGTSIDVNAGQAMTTATHISGYNSGAYDKMIQAAFEEKDISKRAELLHNAEKQLLDDMPVIPVMFNQVARVISGNLKSLKINYYQKAIFTNVKIPDYYSRYEDFDNLTSEGLVAWIG
ncbi:MAG: hypothetical protein IJT60_05105 [Clostridia bacterium]|nr:hypothetical protein [Clostridia bacterium]